MTARTAPDLADRYGLTLDACEVDDNPNMDDMGEGSTHWEVTLTADDGKFGDHERYMTFTFSMGSALVGPPSLYDVLSCVASDAAMWENGKFDSFDDYRSSFGVVADSRKAFADFERTRDAVQRQTGDLHSLLGDEAFASLLSDEDVQ